MLRNVYSQIDFLVAFYFLFWHIPLLHLTMYSLSLSLSLSLSFTLPSPSPFPTSLSPIVYLTLSLSHTHFLFPLEATPVFDDPWHVSLKDKLVSSVYNTSIRLAFTVWSNFRISVDFLSLSKSFDRPCCLFFVCIHCVVVWNEH